MEEFKDILFEIIDQIKNLAPALWAIMLKQAYVSALKYGIGFAFFSYLTYLASRYKKDVIRRKEDPDGEPSEEDALSWILLIAPLAVSLIFLSATAARLINPGYYALEILIDAVKNKGL